MAGYGVATVSSRVERSECHEYKSAGHLPPFNLTPKNEESKRCINAVSPSVLMKLSALLAISCRVVGKNCMLLHRRQLSLFRRDSIRQKFPANLFVLVPTEVIIVVMPPKVFCY